MAEGNPVIIAGAMTGTSLDGIDWATISIPPGFPENELEFIGGSSYSFPPSLRNRLFDIVSGESRPVSFFLETEELLTDFYEETFSEHLKRFPEKPDLLACHGQTIWHDPAPVNKEHPTRGTWQILNGQRLAVRLQTPVIWQFRQADMAAGGQGAPLVPLADDYLFYHYKPCLVLNIGGIANLTILPSDGPVSGFDTGPGNMVIDFMANRFFQKPYDECGTLAASGKINEQALKFALQHPFFSINPPKSTGREDFSNKWIINWINHFPSISDSDWITTTTELTARSVTDAINHLPKGFKTLITAGGGVENEWLLQRIRHLIGTSMNLLVSSDVGIPSQFREAIAFAVLGYFTQSGKKLQTGPVTGASFPVRCGIIANPL